MNQDLTPEAFCMNQDLTPEALLHSPHSCDPVLSHADQTSTLGAALPPPPLNLGTSNSIASSCAGDFPSRSSTAFQRGSPRSESNALSTGSIRAPTPASSAASTRSSAGSISPLAASTRATIAGNCSAQASTSC